MINQPISFASRKHNVNNNRRHNKKTNVEKNPDSKQPILKDNPQINKKPSDFDLEHLNYMPKELRDDIKANHKVVTPVLIETPKVEENETPAPKKERSYKNALMGSLMALAALTAPVVIMLDDSDDYGDYPITTQSEFTRTFDMEEDDNTTVPSSYTTGYDEDEDGKRTTPKYKTEFSNESMAEYARDYISGNELVNSLDYSEIGKYQKDVTVLRALLRNGFPKIRRDDPERSEKFGRAIDQAQATIDHIAHRYKLNSQIVGNSDFDNTVSKGEMISALDLKSIQDLPENEQVAILKKATKDVKPFMFSDLQDMDDIKRVNKQLGEVLQRIQNTVDADARKALCKKYGIKESDLK